MPVVGLGSLLKVPEWRNDLRLEAFRERVMELPRPERTTVKDGGEAKVANLGPAGNHCDFRVRVTLSTELPEERVRRHYGAVRVRGVDRDEALLRLWFTDAEGNGARSFVLEALDSTSAGMDLRCH
ncbi:hypothetical protein ACSNOI_44860 [Actinomadura kijaniata]|uniref:hypothetical protein n=1 Tax=Actinomadura kijaniata TaxID=46161 RepID=UPI003F19978E